MRTRLTRFVVVAATTCLSVGLGVGSASAHIGLTPSEAAEGSTQTFTLVIEHGCDESPTNRVSTLLETGFDQVVPESIDGWETVLAGGVVTWTAQPGSEGSATEFSFEARVTAASGTVVPVPVVQECIDGRHDWVQVLQPGQEPATVTEPAPLLTVTEGTPVETTTSTAAPTTTTAPTTTEEVPATTAAPATSAAPTTSSTDVPATTVAVTTAPEDDGGGSAAPFVIGAVAAAGLAAGAAIALRRRNDP